MTEAFKIGDAAAELGIEAHVLRHWESVGLLTPARTPSGHRAYDRDTLDRARLVRTLQRAGMSLPEIRDLSRADPPDRLALVAAKRAELHTRLTLLRATDRFLAHVLECRHPVIADCPDCATFAGRRN
ncbi:MerR family transcriptional regulator [Nocardia sp. NPDC004068]|uniref:MerR family transcriptional regulator n=1 Tax=Nocardia sp. NPDC004068 TaxID=3364303 RepID=UPI0036BD1076